MLHNTDYNNFSDLSYFVSEYNKEKNMIKECEQFYASFLESKLWTFNKLINYEYLSLIDMNTIDNDKIYNMFIYEFINVINMLTDNIFNKKKYDILSVDELNKFRNELIENTNFNNNLNIELALRIASTMPSDFIDKLSAKHYIDLQKMNIDSFIAEIYCNTFNTTLDEFQKTYGTEYDKYYYKFNKLVNDIKIIKKPSYSDNSDKLHYNLFYYCSKIKNDFLKQCELNGLDFHEKQIMFSSISIRNTECYFNNDTNYLENELESNINKMVVWAAQQIKKLNLIEFFPKTYYILDVNKTLYEFTDNLKNVKIFLSKNNTELLCQSKSEYKKNKFYHNYGVTKPVIQYIYDKTLVFDVYTNELIKIINNDKVTEIQELNN